MGITTQIKLLRFRRTKIVATVGPSSNSPEMIRKLIQAGVNVFRLNMSHGTHESHRKVYDIIRGQAEELNLPIAVLADLCGPKIRCGLFEDDSIELTDGQEVIVTTRDVKGEPGLIPSQYTALAEDVRPGNRILMDDGNMELTVEKIEETEIFCRVVHGGILKNHKGINLPGVEVSAPSITEKDRKDAVFSLELGVDFLALSFVRRSKEVIELKNLIAKQDAWAAVIVKIEKPEALENIQEIIQETDAVMIARGDLGVELPPQMVPMAQDQLISLARKHRKPVIVATQMLESMIENPRPTRAEVSDVANAVQSGTDAVMLSGETAAGKYPLEAVKMMDQIARQSEGVLWQKGIFGSLSNEHEVVPPIPIEDAVARTTAQLSRDLMVRAIMVVSFAGRSIAVISSFRPAAPVVGITPSLQVYRMECLMWGCIPKIIDSKQLDNAETYCKKAALDLNLAEPGQTILVVRGFSNDSARNLPMISVVTV
ncbi:MAG TPA: pyruvate kinase [Verrucomicrobiales bacterium]|nr:pyruvate kinase [Verrucomicrobiales bacterium]